MGARGVMVGVVVLSVVVGGAAVADEVFRDRTEEQIAADMQAGIPGLDVLPEVTISGWPFLTQVMSGELDDMHVAASEATIEGLTLQDIDVQLHGVTTEMPYRARDAEMTAFISLESIQGALPVDAELSIEDQQLVSSFSIFGLPLNVAFTPRADGRAIAVDVETLRFAGVTVEAQDLPQGVVDQLQGLSVPVEGLPEGVEISDLELLDDGANLTAEGSDVVLELPSG